MFETRASGFLNRATNSGVNITRISPPLDIENGCADVIILKGAKKYKQKELKKKCEKLFRRRREDGWKGKGNRLNNTSTADHVTDT